MYRNKQREFRFTREAKEPNNVKAEVFQFPTIWLSKKPLHGPGGEVLGHGQGSSFKVNCTLIVQSI